jgi:hypothetical protein
MFLGGIGIAERDGEKIMTLDLHEKSLSIFEVPAFFGF